MKDELVRFGVAMEASLLGDLDAIVAEREVTRSEVLRDLVRAEVVRSRVARGVQAIATLTLVYDHHVRELSERLTELQHQLGERVRSTLHIHLDENRCLEIVVLRGRSDELQLFADRLLATRGVTHGGLDIVADEAHERATQHANEHDPGHAHPHPHPHPHRHRAGGRKSQMDSPSPKRARGA